MGGAINSDGDIRGLERDDLNLGIVVYGDGKFRVFNRNRPQGKNEVTEADLKDCIPIHVQ